MLRFLTRKLAYGLAILIGINLLTFVLFFKVNTPDDMARMQLGGKRVTPDAIEKWKAERGYDRPLFFNEQEQGIAQLSNTLFMDSSLRMFAFDFGRADSGRDIASEIVRRAGPSIALALPTFVVGLGVSIVLALGLAFFRATYLDFWALFCAWCSCPFRRFFSLSWGSSCSRVCCSSCPFRALRQGWMLGVSWCCQLLWGSCLDWVARCDLTELFSWKKLARTMFGPLDPKACLKAESFWFMFFEMHSSPS
jgi:hypothetical protein